MGVTHGPQVYTIMRNYSRNNWETVVFIHFKASVSRKPNNYCYQYGKAKVTVKTDRPVFVVDGRNGPFPRNITITIVATRCYSGEWMQPCIGLFWVGVFCIEPLPPSPYEL